MSKLHHHACWLHFVVLRCVLSHCQPLQEPGIPHDPTLFTDNRARRTVLQGKTFVFSSSRSFKKLSSLVTSAGGVCQLLSDAQLPALKAGTILLAKTADDIQPSPAMVLACG